MVPWFGHVPNGRVRWVDSGFFGQNPIRIQIKDSGFMGQEVVNVCIDGLYYSVPIGLDMCRDALISCTIRSNNGSKSRKSWSKICFVSYSCTN